jgi:putative Mg2+ transporter-C (MgtC) family protein
MFDPSTTEVTMRVIAALLCGGAIGFDRELRSHSAGMRTHALAAEGAALAGSHGPKIGMKLLRD